MAEQDTDKYTGVHSYERSGGYVLEEYLPELTNTRGKRVMRTMIDDDTFGGILFVLSAIFRSIEWSVKLPEQADGDPDYEAKREYLEHALFHDIGTINDPDSFLTFDDLVQMALDMFPWGYSLISPVLRRRDDGLVGIERLIQIAPETVDRWEINEPLGNITGVYQNRPAGDFATVLIDRKEFLHFKTQPWKGSPEGRSLFRAAYKAWYRRERFQTTEAILHERGCGFPVVTYDPEFKKQAQRGDQNAAALVKVLDSLPSKIRQNERSGVAMAVGNYKNPDGSDSGNPRVKLDFAAIGRTNQVDARAAIRDYDMKIARSVMAQFMFNGSDAGNRALDKSQTSTFLKAINGFAEIIAGVVNRQLVTKMWALNGWQDDEVMPFVAFGSLDKADLAEIGSYIHSLSNAGAPIFPNAEVTEYLMGLAGVPYDADSEAEL